jgi:hypothetical protein
MLPAASGFELSARSRSSTFERSGRGALPLVFALCAIGCKLETKAIPATQIVVDVQADAVLRMRTERVELDVWSAPRRAALDDANHVHSQALPKLGSGLEESVWPIRLVFAPRAGDPKRVFELLVTARDGDGQVLTQSKVITGYVEHEARYVSIDLHAACLNVKCQAARETCRNGACEDAWLEPADLPRVPGRRRVPGDSLADAAAADAAQDAAQDAGQDAGRDGAIGVPDAAADAGRDAGVNRCEVNNGGCDPLVTCEMVLGLVACGLCPRGFEDINHDGTRCADIDECKIENGGCDTEHGICTNSIGGFECKCEAGYHGNGRECSVNVPCSEDPAICDTRASCATMNGKKVCLCGAGFAGDGGRCRDVDECAQQKDRCGAHAKCVNTEGSFECKCDWGWTRAGDACVDIDECAANTDNCTNRPNACVNTEGSFMCKCPKGFTGPAVGNQGCNDTDECYEHMANCSSNADCKNTRGSFTCSCKSGFSGDGVNCKRNRS